MTDPATAEQVEPTTPDLKRMLESLAYWSAVLAPLVEHTAEFQRATAALEAATSDSVLRRNLSRAWKAFAGIGRVMLEADNRDWKTTASEAEGWAEEALLPGST